MSGKRKRSASRGKVELRRAQNLSAKQRHHRNSANRLGATGKRKSSVSSREGTYDSRYAGTGNGHQTQLPKTVSFGSLAWDTLSVRLGCLALAASFVFSFWQTLQWLESQWRTIPDYSHGYLVVPLALTLLWLRRDTFPGVTERIDPRGCYLILLALLMRLVGRFGYMDFLDGWAITPLVGGIVWLVLGLPAARWAAPAILFLLMLVPMPFRMETMLSWKLQGIATLLSTASLRICGLPAIAEGHVIWVNDTELMIEKACSGLRIFMGMLALAFFWAASVRRSWIDRLMLIIVAVPLALLTNSARITATAILYQVFPSESTRQLIHDVSGYMMIPLAALLLWCFKCFWECIYRPVSISSVGDQLRRRLKDNSTSQHEQTELQTSTQQS